MEKQHKLALWIDNVLPPIFLVLLGLRVIDTKAVYPFKSGWEVLPMCAIAKFCLGLLHVSIYNIFGRWSFRSQYHPRWIGDRLTFSFRTLFTSPLPGDCGSFRRNLYTYSYELIMTMLDGLLKLWYMIL